MARAPIWLVDFEDSFTHNVAAEVERLGASCQIISWRELGGPAEERPGLLLLGPGPGHPDDYQLTSTLMHWFEAGVPMGGICLGHQLLGRMLGLSVTRSRTPLHGQKIQLQVPPSWRYGELPAETMVQRYNSLAVYGDVLPPGWEGWQNADGEWLALRHPRAISYQFHPESVGTSCPAAWFHPLLRLGL